MFRSPIQTNEQNKEYGQMYQLATSPTLMASHIVALERELREIKVAMGSAQQLRATSPNVVVKPPKANRKDR